MPKQSTKAATKSATKSSQPFRLRRSAVHGTGAFATRTIRKGQRIIEYVGDRISHEEADRRFQQKTSPAHHTFLFTIDSKIVIDAAHNGNDSRFINHSCAPNCEVILYGKRPMIEALQTIREGEELAYDYNLTRDPDDTENEAEKVFACRCGAPTCRGTMLAPLKKKKAPTPSKRAGAKKKASKRAAGGAKVGGAKTSAKRAAGGAKKRTKKAA